VSGKLSIKLVKSVICAPKSQRVIVRTLGLRKTQQTVILPDNPCTRGAAFKVRHLLEVKEYIETE